MQNLAVIYTTQVHYAKRRGRSKVLWDKRWSSLTTFVNSVFDLVHFHVLLTSMSVTVRRLWVLCRCQPSFNTGTDVLLFHMRNFDSIVSKSTLCTFVNRAHSMLMILYSIFDIAIVCIYRKYRHRNVPHTIDR